MIFNFFLPFFFFSQLLNITKLLLLIINLEPSSPTKNKQFQYSFCSKKINTKPQRRCDAFIFILYMRGKKEKKGLKPSRLKFSLEKGSTLKSEFQRFIERRVKNNSEPKKGKRNLIKPFSNNQTQAQLRSTTPACDQSKVRYGRIGIQICQATQRAIIRRYDSDQEVLRKPFCVRHSLSFRKEKQTLLENNSEEKNQIQTTQAYGITKQQKCQNTLTEKAVNENKFKQMKKLQVEAKHYRKMFKESLENLQEIKKKITVEHQQFEIEKKIYEEQIRKLRKNIEARSLCFKDFYPCQYYDHSEMPLNSFIFEKSTQESEQSGQENPQTLINQ